MNISQCKHKSGQMLQAVKQSLTWMPESFDARFPFSVYSFMVSTWYRCAHICLLSSQNSNVWRPNVHVWAHFEPIFSLRVQGGIQTTVSQLAGVRGCRRKRQLSFFAVGCWLFIYWCSEDHNGSFRRVGTAFSGELPTSLDRFALRQPLWPDYFSYKSFDSSTKAIPSLHVISLVVRDWNKLNAKFKITWRHSNRPIRRRP